jgi:hypothetical protein
MKATNFNELTMVDRATLIHEFGSLLMSMEYYVYRIHLFSLNNSFVELYQNIMTGQIERIEEAEYGDLDKYLRRITIRKG